MSRGQIAVRAATIVVTLLSVSQAMAVEPAADDLPRHLGLGIVGLSEQGFGGSLRLRLDWIAFEGAVTASPYIYFEHRCPVGGLSARVTASTLVFLYQEDDAAHGLRIGGVWDDTFGWGGQLGYQVAAAVGERWEVNGGVGLRVMPQGRDRAIRLIEEECGHADVAAFNPFTFVQIYLGFGVMFYVF